MPESEETKEPNESNELKDPSTEDEIKFATLQGWTDKETYKGENWKTAKQFIEEGNKHNAILKDRNNKLVNQVGDMQATMTKLVDDQQQQKDKAVKKAITELKLQKAEAINESDGEKVNKIDDQIDQLREEVKPAAPSNLEFDRWIVDNGWYNSEPMLKAEANMYAKAYIDAGSYPTMREVYDAVARKIKRDFPENFTNPNKKEPASMSGGSHSKNPGANGHGYGDLPKEARDACDRFVKTIPKFTVEKYLEQYEWE